MTDHRAIEEERRAAVESEFHRFDAAMAKAEASVRANVDRVELEGSYPDTQLVIFGVSDSGEPIETREPLWGPESFFDQTDSREGVNVLRTSYVEG
jgi:hypothetical protein